MPGFLFSGASSAPFCRTDQGDDRGQPAHWLPHGGASARVQQEHGAAGDSAARLSGTEAPGRVSAADRGTAFAGVSTVGALGGAGAGPDRPLRHAGAREGALLPALGQRPGLHQPQLHGAGQKLRPEAGVHHALHPTAERSCGADDPEQCIHRPRFETLQHASRVIGDWIQFYNHQRPHQALDMKTPAAAFALAA